MREALINHNETTFYKECPKRETVSRSIFSLLDSSDRTFSIELCPGKNIDEGLLSKLGLNFCSITWHSPSVAQLKCVDKTPGIQLAQRLCCQGYNVLLHLAGRNLHGDLVLDILNAAKGIGVRNIFALQGDPSQIKEKDDAKCDFPYAADLVKFIRAHFGNYFCIGVAGYPDKHPYSVNLEEDVYYLKEKVSNGADFIITQASYDYESFKNFSKRCKESGINLPIIPGIFIISSYKTLINMSKFCAVPISAEVLKIVGKNKDNPKAVREFGIHHTTELMKCILRETGYNFRGVHIFSLNDLELVVEVIKRLGLFGPRLEYPL
ncbi:methylenetetrahydrofolate reductase [Anoplophora glabripennis]|uniref:methylenetetrahydrofolate reductase n=1 Tax=Anoplophora glabripennis TaxID=217634 RepID=UPI0008737185|nr:methylenetetrahydrofolate reductase [Anoplophora glabripennis]